jgi:arylsulfatase A-like enzyme
MRGLVVTAIIGVAILLFAISRRPDIDHSSAQRSNYNLVFITVDTLRADHTPFADYGRNTMPATAEFFQDGLNFTRAETVRTSTAPSYASMLSGLYPYHTGVRNNFAQLNHKIDTLPEMLKRSGLITGAFVSSFVMIGRISGFNQGFDLYDDFVLEKEVTRDSYERTAGNTVKHAISWLEKVPKNRRFFLFLHFIDPHGPYHPPAPYNKSFRSMQTRILARDQIPSDQLIGNVIDQNQYIDWYDGEILYLDSQLRNLYKKLKPLENNSWFLFVADHGESFGERNNFFSHGDSCYAFETKVSMVWLPPVPLRKRYAAKRIQQPVSLVDVTPTSLEVLRVSNKKKFDGESLLPAFRGSRLKNPFRFVERYWGSDLSFAASDSQFKMIKNYRPVPNQRWPHKLISPTTWGEHSAELYDLSSDPAEEKNLINIMKRPEKLSAALDQFIADARKYRPPFRIKKFNIPNEERAEYVQQHAKEQELVFTDEEVEKLKALGYVDK